MIEVTRTDSLLRALEGAKSVELATYEIRKGSPLVGALERAAAHGAAVHVWADGRPYGDAGDGMARGTRAAARALERAGVNVDVVTDRRLHVKAALVDGRAFLDDRNWTASGRDTVVETDDPADIALVRDAIETGTTGANDGFATSKRAALRLESKVIAQAAGDRVDVESESFGTFGGPYTALKARARVGDSVRLIVSSNELHGSHAAQERAALRVLRGFGVEERVGSSRSGAGNEKLCVAGDRGWTGSANASFGSADATDWGLSTKDARVVAALQARFDQNWAASVPYAG